MPQTALHADEVATAAEIEAAWNRLRTHLETRARSLCEEVRHYPGPIARCDVQLTHLLEERGRALAQASLAAASDRSLLAQLIEGDDPLGRELAERLASLVAPQRRRA